MAIFHSFFMAELYFITYMYTGNIWASLVAQVVKNLPEMQEIWFQSLHWEDPLEKGMATHSVFLPRESHDRGVWQATIHRIAKELDMTEQLTHMHT